MIINFKSDVDVILTYSVINEITGHLFEVFDYYFLLKKFYNVKILLLTALKKEQIVLALSKYNINNIDEVFNDIVHVQKYSRIKVINAINSIIIVCDGNIYSFKHNNWVFACKQILCFMCLNYDQKYRLKGYPTYENSIFLQDYRVYGKNKSFQSIDYIKKINFNMYKTQCNPAPNNTALLYITTNCRNMDLEDIKKLLDEYTFEKYVILTPEPWTLNEKFEKDDRVTIYEPPINNLFNTFDTYIYTPVARHFDCSPRFITECKYYNKKVLYHNINYNDIGLETRRKDINENFLSLILDENDQIINIIKELL